jgi:lipopolysaccharide transport system permease protein
MTVSANRPAIRIRAEDPAPAFAISEIWSYRELLWSFCSRELLVRHKQTLLGPLWIVLQPLLHAAVFALFVNRIARVPSDGSPYALFAYAGLLPWLFFSNGVQSLSYGLMMNSHLVNRVYFPRVLIPISMVLVRLLDFAAAIAVFVLLGLILGLNPSWNLLIVPALMAQAAVLVLAAGAWCSTFTSRFRDFGTLLPVALQFAMFASPVIYPASLVPAEWRLAYFLNPTAALVETFRAALLGREMPVQIWLISLAVTALLAVVLLRGFSRSEQAAVEAL